MTLSISIMAHPSRKHYVDYLLEQLGDVPIAWDREQGIWDTCRRAWLLRNPESVYHVVIQDDAIICQDFYNRAVDILKTLDDNTACMFYTGERAEHHAKYHKAPFYTNKIYNEVAICLPTKHIKPMLKWCDDFGQDTDKSISRYCKRNKVRMYNAFPSLIDHREDTSIYRVRYNRPEPDAIRHALWFVDNPPPEWLTN
jgi:hypothetical protein